MAYNIMLYGLRGNKGYKGKLVELEGICRELKSDLGSCVIPSRYSGLLEIGLGEKVRFEHKWHLLSGIRSFLESYRDMYVLAGAMEAGMMVKIRGKVTGNPDDYVVKAHGVRQIGSLDSLILNGENIAGHIREIDEMISWC